MIVNEDIPNLMNGVSQQAAALRLPTQLASQENYYSTIVDGLKKRPRTEHVARILPSAPSGVFAHIIDRDVSERYVVLISNGVVRVFDFDGVEKTVNAPNGWGYITGLTNAEEEIRALTIADFTLILNRNRTVAMGGARSPTRPAEALVNVVAGNYDKKYAVTINGVEFAGYGTPSSANNLQIVANNGGGNNWSGGTNSNSAPVSGDPLNNDVGLRPNQAIATTEIAKRLTSQLIANLGNSGNPWGVGLHVNVVHIINYQNDFAIGGEDGVNGNAMRVIKGSIQRFSDLPNFAPLDFVVEVRSSNGTDFDNYWVVADKGNNPNNSSVIWREVPKPNTVLGFDAGTMPHVLVREANGTFTFRPVAWENRVCGDGVKINPDPSFVGRKIEDLFYFRNRLGFLADENAILSRAGDPFNFFRQTATALLDDDPIDVASTHIKVSILKHAVPFQDTLLLFSEDTQFRLAGNELLTPKTASIRALTEYSCSARVKPAVVGEQVFFISDEDPANRQAESQFQPVTLSSPFASAYEMAYDRKMETVEAAEITAHVPSYIPAGCYAFVGSVDEGCLVALTKSNRAAMFVYRYFWSGEEKLQSSWSRWTFPGATILNAQWINSDLYIVVLRTGGVFLERLQMDTSAVDPGLGFLAGLDRCAALYTPPSVSLDPDDTTVLSLPSGYNAPAGIVCIEAATGVERQIVSSSSSSITIRGRNGVTNYYVGYPYESRARLSRLFPRQPTRGGATVSRQEGRTQIQHLSIVLDKTGYFRVELTRPARLVERVEFSPIRAGNPDTIIATDVNLYTGRTNVPVMSRNTEVEIDLVNDSWLPSGFISLSWRGVWNQKSREV